jgi:hypothetical protein
MGESKSRNLSRMGKTGSDSPTTQNGVSDFSHMNKARQNVEIKRWGSVQQLGSREEDC